MTLHLPADSANIKSAKCWASWFFCIMQTLIQWKGQNHSYLFFFSFLRQEPSLALGFISCLGMLHSWLLNRPSPSWVTDFCPRLVLVALVLQTQSPAESGRYLHSSRYVHCHSWWRLPCRSHRSCLLTCSVPLPHTFVTITTSLFACISSTLDSTLKFFPKESPSPPTSLCVNLKFPFLLWTVSQPNNLVQFPLLPSRINLLQW